MALEDTVNEGLDSEGDNSDEGDSDLPEEESVSDKSDRLYNESFGKGKFVPNEWGSRTFIPQAQIDSEKAAKRQADRGPAAIDPETMSLPNRQTSSEYSHPQITRLRQLAMAAHALKDVPEAMRSRILGRLLGINPNEQAQSNQQNQLRRALMLAQYRNQLASPQRQQQQENREEGLQLRKEGLQNRQEDRARGRSIQKQMMQLRKQQIDTMNELHMDRAFTNITGAIDRKTKQIAMMPDGPDKIQQNKELLQLHQLADKYSKFIDKTGQSGEESLQ